jgi:hypothetical protein
MSNEKPLAVGGTVSLPFRVIAVTADLVQLETVKAYGHENPQVPGELKGRTKTALWAKPSQLSLKDPKVGDSLSLDFRVNKIGGIRSPLVNLEAVEAFGRENPSAPGPLKGRIKASLWAEPEQLEGVAAAV